MQCPKCKGGCFDETTSRYWNGGLTTQGKKKPRWKCKDKANCDGVVWENTPKQAPQPAANQAQSARPATIARPLAPLYAQCLELAVRIVKAKLGPNMYTSSDVMAGAATLFIQACRDGSPLLPPPKPKPAPVPVQPEPEDYPDEAPEYSSVEGLPF